MIAIDDLWPSLTAAAAPSEDAWDIGPVIIPGTPRPQGSKKAIVRKGAKHASLVESSPHVASWRTDIRDAVAKVATEPLMGPLEVRAVFTFQRPASHHVAGDRSRPVKPGAPAWCTSHSAGDLDKLQRAIGDALAGIAWDDDDQIVHWDPWKSWGLHPSLELSIRRMRA